MSVPTPHIEAKFEEIADTVIMPGDPLRAEFIAKNFLEDAVCFNNVRGMLGFTGYYKGKRVSTMGHGMGMPSVGIYTYELFNFYKVENIIRVGSAGGLREDIGLRDIVIAMGTCTNSNYVHQYSLPGSFAPIASYELLEKAMVTAKQKGIEVKVGNILTSDIFYDEFSLQKEWLKMGVLAVEMEAAALYMNAARAGKKALCICTVSDLPFTGESCSAEERQTTFTQMIELALEMA
ncbi:MAG: purine-nucleoside phosphorylase [Clostridiales bacterium]|nr:purine-nucleoside phosphorylase [Clostridiales bacterium]